MTGTASDATPPEATAPETPPDRGPGSRRRRLLFFGLSGAVVVAALWIFRGVLLPFLLAIVVAYVLAPLVSRMSRKMPRWIAVVVLYVGIVGALAAFVSIGIPALAVEVERLASEGPRYVREVRDEWIPAVEETFRESMAEYGEGETPTPDRRSPSPPPAAVPDAGVATGLDGGIAPLDGGTPRRLAVQSDAVVVTPIEGGGFQVILPPSGIEVRETSDGVLVVGADPKSSEERGDITTALTEALARQAENTEGHALTFIRTAQTLITAVVKGVFTFVIMLMLSAYLLATSDRIFAFVRSLVQPEKRSRFDDLLRRIDRGLSGVVRGQIIIALVNGVLSGIGFYLLDLKYWPILTLIATVLSIIPIFGSIISTIPAVLVGLQDGFGTALLVLLWIIGIHQLEANVLNPKIMGDSAKVHPVLVIFALLAGEHLFGIVGALLAVPVLSITQSLFLHYREVALGIPVPRTIPPPPPAPADDTLSDA